MIALLVFSLSGFAEETLSGVDKKSLLEEFQRAQMTEWRALLHRQKTDLDGLKEAHRIRENEFEQSKRREKSEKFQTLQSGEERRALLKKQQEDRKQHQGALKTEIEAMKTEHQAERERLRTGQQERRNSFEEHLERGVRPPHALWSTYNKPKQRKAQKQQEPKQEMGASTSALQPSTTVSSDP